MKRFLDLDFMDIAYEDDMISIVEVLVMHDGLNRNQCNIPKDVIINALPTLANKPLVGIPNKPYLKSYSDDFVEHARSDSDKENTIVFGVFTESSVKNYKFIEKDGRNYLRVEAILFKNYSPIAMNIIKKRDGNCKISIEISAAGVTNSQKIFDISEFIFNSAMMLGVDIEEGILGSSMNVLKFSLDNDTVIDCNKRYVKFALEDKYKIPLKVKENAKQALELRKEFSRGGTATLQNMAKYIVNNEYATFAKLKKLNQYFSKHSIDEISDLENPSNEYISFGLLGGKESLEWSKKIVDKKEEVGDNLEKSIEEFIATDEVGTGETIKINKDKDALSDYEWGNVDKSELKKKCLKAKNYKELCKAVFLKLEDKWEEGIEGSLGYPVMEIKDGEAVYNRSALGSAKAYATKNNEEDVLSSLKGIYEKLELPWDIENSVKEEVEGMEENKFEFCLNSRQMREIFDNAVSGIKYISGDYDHHKYYVEAYDEMFVYLCDNETNKTIKVTFVIENNIATIDFESQVEVIRGGYVEVGVPEVEEIETEEPIIEDVVITNAVEGEEVEEEVVENAMETKTEDEEMVNKYHALEEELNTLKATFSEMENRCNSAEEKVATFERKEEQSKMFELIKEYAHCMSKEDMEVMNSKVETATFAEMDTMVTEKAKEFAKKSKVEEPVVEEVKNSYDVSFSMFEAQSGFNFAKETRTNDLKSIIEKSGVKINIK